MNKLTKISTYPVLKDDDHLLQITGSRGGIRVYKRPGSKQPLWSVTTILHSSVAKPALAPWANKQGRLAVEETLAPHVDKVLTREVLDRALEYAQKRPRETSTVAADVGSVIHDLVSAYIITGKAPHPEMLQANPLVLTAWQSFREFERDYEPMWIASEFACFSQHWGYAGSVDALAKIDGKYAVIDFKTGAGLYPEYAIQAAAYSNALSTPLMIHERADPMEWEPWEEIVPYVIRLGKESQEYEVRTVTHPDTALEGFLSALRMWQTLGISSLSKTAQKEIREHLELPEQLPVLW